MKDLRLTDMISGVRYKIVKGSMDSSIPKDSQCYLTENGSMDIHFIVNQSNDEIVSPLKKWSIYNNEVVLNAIENEFHILRAKINTLVLKAQQLKEQL